MIKIIHTNDIHGRVEADSNTGVGMSQFASIIKEIRESSSTLLLDAGDTIHGLPVVSISKGSAMIEIMNKMKYDAMVPGNHDFNYGRERLLELAQLAEFPIIAANIYDENGERLLKPYIVKAIDGVKVGIFGITTPESYYKTKPENIAGLEFRNPLEEAERIVEELREKERVDIVIALTHLGLDRSTDMENRSDGLASRAKGIDLIVDGHSHTQLKEGLCRDGVYIAQTGDYMKNLGLISLELDGKEVISCGMELISREEIMEIKEDLSLKAILTDIEQSNKDATSNILGKSEKVLDGERENVRTRETSLGSLLADAMKYMTKADVAITNGGGIRGSINPGFITKRDVISALPFGNYVITKEVRGEDIVKALEHGVSHYPEPSSAFPHVGGISFRLDYTKEIGERVYDVSVGGAEIDLTRKYRLATNDFLASGGDSYYMFKSARLISEYPSIDEVLSAYIQAKFEISSSSILPRVELTDRFNMAKAI
jgi:2',3'-cyclic-nucleotide 2'-phosphodiesterase (5'-nucleotidase family)